MQNIGLGVAEGVNVAGTAILCSTGPMVPLAPLLLLAAAQGPSVGPEARGTAREVLEQLLAEDEKVYRFRDHRGHDLVTISGRPRASDHRGICQVDRLEIERDSGGAIRKIETIHQFRIVTGGRDRPRWDLRGEELEKSCAAAGGSDRWFTAPEAYSAEAAVVGLLGLKEELLKPGPVAGTWSCRGRNKACPDPKDIAERIDPLVPQGIAEGGHAGVPCPDGKYCVSVSLAMPDCSHWVTQLRLERDGGFRFHSARAGWQVSPHDCPATMFDPAVEGLGQVAADRLERRALDPQRRPLSQIENARDRRGGLRRRGQISTCMPSSTTRLGGRLK